MAMAAPPRPVERIRNFFSRIGLPPDHDYTAQFTQRAQQAQEAGDTTLVDRAKRRCSGMLGFTLYRFPRYRPSDVHRLVCAQLERVEAREIDRLMLLMPPRHGKSELASKSYPAWSIGRKPWKQFISGSASMPLAQDWGREVRNIVNSEAFQLVYETRLSPDSQAAGKWNTQQGGSYYSVGVEGGVMGRGAHDIMLDDLYANMEEAASPVIREKVWKWYSGTIYNRLEPGGAIVLINHRMHEDDLSGRLIEKMKSGKERVASDLSNSAAAASAQNPPAGRVGGLDRNPSAETPADDAGCGGLAKGGALSYSGIDLAAKLINPSAASRLTRSGGPRRFRGPHVSRDSPRRGRPSVERPRRHVKFGRDLLVRNEQVAVGDRRLRRERLAERKGLKLALEVIKIAATVVFLAVKTQRVRKLRPFWKHRWTSSSSTSLDEEVGLTQPQKR